MEKVFVLLCLLTTTAFAEVDRAALQGALDEIQRARGSMDRAERIIYDLMNRSSDGVTCVYYTDGQWKG